jgi:succinoglycan biosynthesis protein ExoA
MLANSPRRASLSYEPSCGDVRLKISVVVPARNERTTLPDLLAAIESQTLRPDEVIIADGMSNDGTREWLADACASRPWLRVVDNPAVGIAAGLNTAIEQARNPLVARMDAHAVYAHNYLESVHRVFLERDDVVAVGGIMDTQGRGKWGMAIASVLRRRFGLGGASHRIGGPGGPVDHVFSPAYRREAVVSAGGFDETMRANEDFELDYRLRRAGGVVWLEEEMRCTWFTRESLGALSSQMFRYGHFKARTLWMWPDSIRYRQMAPPALIVSLGMASIANPIVGGVGWSAYLVVASGLGSRAALEDGSSSVRAAIAVPVVHLSWTAGLLIGMWSHRHARSSRKLRTPSDTL